MTALSNAGIFFPEIQCEIPFEHLTLISGRQMTIRASTIVTFLLAMTKSTQLFCYRVPALESYLIVQIWSDYAKPSSKKSSV